MNKLISVMVSLIFSLTTLSGIAAVNIVECEDNSGNRSFQKTCPPGSSVVGEKKLSTGKKEGNNEKSTLDINVTLYSVPDCDTCDEVREFFQNRNVSITEKDVNSNINYQTELKELTGALKIPCVTVGDKTIIGYNRKELKDALVAIGFKGDS